MEVYKLPRMPQTKPIVSIVNVVSSASVEQKMDLIEIAKKFQGKTFGFILKNSKPLRIPIPWKGQLGFFDVDLPKIKIKNNKIMTDMIEEEFSYQWVGHH